VSSSCMEAFSTVTWVRRTMRIGGNRMVTNRWSSWLIIPYDTAFRAPLPPSVTKNDAEPISFTPVRNEADCTRWALSCPRGHQLEEPQLSHGGGMRRRTSGRLGMIHHHRVLGRQRDQGALRGLKARGVEHALADIFHFPVPPIVA